MNRIHIAGSAVIAVLAVAESGGAAARDELIFHAEAADGSVLRSQHGDLLFNPASVVKVGTSLWALDSLGEDHRYTTVFGIEAGAVVKDGEVSGRLVIHGGGDPDFHRENVYLVAAELNRLGIRRFSGGIVVSGSLWMGWGNGTVHQVGDPTRRAEIMAKRVRDSLDPKRWDTTAHASWEAMCKRRGLDAGAPPRVQVSSEIRVERDKPPMTEVVAHRSNPLPTLLRRFNVYSNNDIIRVADGLGGPQRLQAFLSERLAAPAGRIDLETASGEHRNRMSARLVVRLLRDFARSARAEGLQPADLLPVIGCDPGPTRRMFPKLAAGELAHTVVCKTGTLTTTDGGVAVLAGTFNSPDRGEVTFCVAAGRAGGRIRYWRNLEQQWLVDLIQEAGGATAVDCGEELPFSDGHALVEEAAATQSR